MEGLGVVMEANEYLALICADNYPTCLGKTQDDVERLAFFSGQGETLEHCLQHGYTLRKVRIDIDPKEVHPWKG